MSFHPSVTWFDPRRAHNFNNLKLETLIRILDISITGQARITFMEIDDMKQETNKAVQETASETPAAVKAAPKRSVPHRFTDEQKADIIRRYKAGEGPKAISESLGCSRSLITHIIRDAGAVEGRTGAHLNKGKKKEPVQEPAADMSPDDVPEVVETEDERYTRLRKERLAWQKAHPNKWS